VIRFLWGVSAMGAWAVGLHFLRFWRETRDRLFAFFAAAFWILGFNWLGLALTNPAEEARTYFYVLRLVAFLLIIGAVLDKNRRRD
jgi:hypothetical protein